MIKRANPTRYFTSEDMRGLQTQINELWQVIDRFVVDVESPGAAEAAKALEKPQEVYFDYGTNRTYAPDDPVNPQPFIERAKK